LLRRNKDSILLLQDWVGLDRRDRLKHWIPSFCVA
jgi:hypothetical protein